MKNLFLIISIIIYSANVFSQTSTTEEPTKKEAKDYYAFGDFRIARDMYYELIKTDFNNPDYNYKLGMCYLESHIDDRKFAIPYLKRNLKSEFPERDIYFQLGRAYHLTDQFDSAVYYYKQFADFSKDPFTVDLANRQIEMVNNAKMFVNQRKNVIIRNLGEEINSPEMDYYPFVHPDQEYLIFSTRRDKLNPGYVMTDGWKSGDIFWSKDKRGEWASARSMGGSVAGTLDEECVGLSNNSERMFININSYEVSGDISISEKKGRQYQKAYQLGPNVNTPFSEVTAFVNEEGDKLYFCSDKPEGSGEYDLYVSNLLPDGTWGPSQNMGETINTPYSEHFPMLSRDEKTFYFSSQGHNSMGGYDLFKSEWDEKTQSWGNPENLGYPINTTDDDMNITFTKNMTTAYISSYRKNGIGDLDIYEVTFPEVEPPKSLYQTKILTKKPIDYNDYITFIYAQKGDLKRKFIGDFPPPDTTWKIINTKKAIVPMGKYYKTTLVYTKDGQDKGFSMDKLPEDIETWEFKDIRVNELPIEGFKPPSKNRPTETDVVIEDPIFSVFDENGDLMGDYLPNKKSKLYSLILPPGKYEFAIEADGYKPVNQFIVIQGLSSFQDIIKKDFYLDPITPHEPLHYSELEISEE